MINGTYACGWYWTDLDDVVTRYGQYHVFVACGYHCVWLPSENRYVVRGR